MMSQEDQNAIVKAFKTAFERIDLLTNKVVELQTTVVTLENAIVELQLLGGKKDE